MRAEITKIGKHGTIVIPMPLRRQFHFKEGDYLIAEDHHDGILIRPAAVLPIENYSPERQAEFLLSNSIDEEDYQQAQEAVQKMGLDPHKVKHYRPKSN